jgi:hypothetical protein
MDAQVNVWYKDTFLVNNKFLTVSPKDEGQA